MSFETEIKGKTSTGELRTLRTDDDGQLQIDVVANIDAAQGSGVISSTTLRTVAATDAIYSTQAKFIARQTNPTAVADAAESFGTSDDLGRQLTWPFQVRDLLATAYTVLTRGTETSILAAAASTLHDIVTISASNTSSIAQVVSIATGTAGAVVDRIVIPVTSTVVKNYSVPLLQSEVAQVWTATNGTQSDLSDSPVAITVTAIKNI